MSSLLWPPSEWNISRMALVGKFPYMPNIRLSTCAHFLQTTPSCCCCCWSLTFLSTREIIDTHTAQDIFLVLLTWKVTWLFLLSSPKTIMPSAFLSHSSCQNHSATNKTYRNIFPSSTSFFFTTQKCFWPDLHSNKNVWERERDESSLMTGRDFRQKETDFGGRLWRNQMMLKKRNPIPKRVARE